MNRLIKAMNGGSGGYSEWLKLVIVIMSMIGGLYYAVAKLDTHITNKELHQTRAELTDMFVTRREWESNHKSLREDMLYLRQKVDLIYEKLASPQFNNYLKEVREK